MIDVQLNKYGFTCMKVNGIGHGQAMISKLHENHTWLCMLCLSKQRPRRAFVTCPKNPPSQSIAYEQLRDANTDLFLRRFREGISFQTLWRGSSRSAPLQALHCAFCSTEQSTFRGGEKAKMCREKGRKRVASKGGKKEKRKRENRSE